MTRLLWTIRNVRDVPSWIPGTALYLCLFPTVLKVGITSNPQERMRALQSKVKDKPTLMVFLHFESRLLARAIEKDIAWACRGTSLWLSNAHGEWLAVEDFEKAKAMMLGSPDGPRVWRTA